MDEPWEPPHAPLEAPQLPADPTSVGGGVGLCFLCHLGLLVAPPLLLLVGILEWLYLVPLILVARSKGYHNRVRGLWIGGFITLGAWILAVGAVVAACSGMRI